jgi:flavorubredoxin
MARIDAPHFSETRRLTDNWSVLPSWLPIPGLGALAVNSHLLKTREPMLIDTGVAMLGDEFLAALRREIDPADLAWIWLSHTDADHIGNLNRVLALAPKAKVITNFLGMAKMQLQGFDTSRVQLFEPGTVLDIGGHRLHPVRPPYYDAPETTGFFDEKDRVLYAVDSFGALLPESAENLEDIAEPALRDGMVSWSSIDAPWLAGIDRNVLGRTLASLDSLDPAYVLSGHLPFVHRNIKTLTRIVAGAYGQGGTMATDPLAITQVAAAMEMA